MAATIAFLLALFKLLLVGLLAWGVLLLTPLPDWAKRVGEVLIAAIIIFALLSDLVAAPVAQGNLPFPLNPSTPTNPSRVK